MPGVIRDLTQQNMARVYRNDPVRWAEEYMGLEGQIWSKVREMLCSVRDFYGTGVAAGHGVSKSWSAGLVACWWIDTHPLGETETFVATSAPSKAQVDAVWSYVRMFHRRAQDRFDAKLIDHPLPGYITSGAEVRWKLPNGDTIGQGRKPPDNKTDIAFQGRHATYLMVIGDEATGFGDDMLSAFNNIATGKHNRQLLLLNPTDPTCAAAKLWPRPAQSDSEEDRPGAVRWNFIRISMYDSPAVTMEEGIDLDKLDGISGPGTIESYLDRYPEDDPEFTSRVKGDWPWGTANGILFTGEVLARAMRCCVIPDPEDKIIQFGLDVARAGKDSSVVYEARVGEVWETDPETDKPTKRTGKRGLHVRFVQAWNGAFITSEDPDNPGTAQRLHALAMARGATDVNVDAGGLGIGVIDAIRDMNPPYSVFEIYGQTQQGVDKRAYNNLRAEQYGELRNNMYSGLVDIDDRDTTLLDELRAIRYSWLSNGSMAIESKDDMKRRGVKSPDYADALWYSCVELEAAKGPQPGDVVAVDPDDFVPENPWFDRVSGLGSFGW